MISWRTWLRRPFPRVRHTVLEVLVALSLAFLIWLYARSRDQDTLDDAPIPVQIGLAPGTLGEEVLVLREQEPPQQRRSIQKVRVVQRVGSVFLRGQDVDAPLAQTTRDSAANMRVHVEPNHGGS